MLESNNPYTSSFFYLPFIDLCVFTEPESVLFLGISTWDIGIFLDLRDYDFSEVTSICFTWFLTSLSKELEFSPAKTVDGLSRPFLLEKYF